MQNTSIDFLFKKIIHLEPNNKYNHLLENHVGPQIIDLLFFKPKKILSAKIIDNLENIEDFSAIIIKVKIIKHYQNFFNRKVPYKISTLFNDKRISLVFFSKHTGYLRKIYPQEKEIFIKGKLEFYNNTYQILHPEIVDKKHISDKKSLHQVFYKQKKTLKSDTIQS